MKTIKGSKLKGDSKGSNALKHGLKFLILLESSCKDVNYQSHCLLSWPFFFWKGKVIDVTAVCITIKMIGVFWPIFCSNSVILICYSFTTIHIFSMHGVIPIFLAWYSVIEAIVHYSTQWTDLDNFSLILMRLKHLEWWRYQKCRLDIAKYINKKII